MKQVWKYTSIAHQVPFLFYFERKYTFIKMNDYYNQQALHQKENTEQHDSKQVLYMPTHMNELPYLLDDKHERNRS